MRRNPGTRALLATVLAAVTSVLGLSAGSASAVPQRVGLSAVGNVPSVAAGKQAQLAADVQITPSGLTTLLVSAKEKFELTVDLEGKNCSSADDYVSFSSPPKVTADVTDPNNQTDPAFVATTESSAACTGVGKKDKLVLTATGDGNPASVTVSGIKYDVGANPTNSQVRVKVGGDLVQLAPNPVVNAVVQRGQVSVDPLAGVGVGDGQKPGNVVIEEYVPGALAAGYVGVGLIAPNQSGTTNATFTSGKTPTVSYSKGDGKAASTQRVNDKCLAFSITKPSTSPTIYTLSGISLDVTNAGPVPASVGVSSSDAASACKDVSLTPANGLLLTEATDVARMGGADRFATAATVAKSTPAFACNASKTHSAILARGDQYPDALAASYLAGQKTAPTLLTTSGAIPEATLSALKTLGTTNVALIGGQAAINSAVEEELKSTPAYGCDGKELGKKLEVERIGGDNRYDTAVRVAESTGNTVGTLVPGGGVETSGATPVRTAIVTSGTNFPDAVVAGPIAYRGTHANNGNQAGFPLLLTEPTRLSTETKGALQSLNIHQVLIPGDVGAVSKAVESEIQGLAKDMTIIRFPGADRNDTAAKVAYFATTVPEAKTAQTAEAVGLGHDSTTVLLARGDGFADALAGGPHGGAEGDGVPILLTSDPYSLGDNTATYLTGFSGASFDGGIINLRVLGDQVAVSDSVVKEARDELAKR